MLNREKFKDEIMEIACSGDKLALDKRINKLVSCINLNCRNCRFNDPECVKSCKLNRKEWCNSEYVEPEVDWSKVPVNTPVLVSHYEADSWTNRYFACYKDGKVFTYDCGATSWSTPTDDDISSWKYAKLASEEDIRKYAK